MAGSQVITSAAVTLRFFNDAKTAYGHFKPSDSVRKGIKIHNHTMRTGYNKEMTWQSEGPLGDDEIRRRLITTINAKFRRNIGTDYNNVGAEKKDDANCTKSKNRAGEGKCPTTSSDPTAAASKDKPAEGAQSSKASRRKGRKKQQKAGASSADLANITDQFSICRLYDVSAPFDV